MGLKTQISVDSEVAPQHDISYRESLYHLGIKFKYKYSSMIEQLCFSDYDLMTEAYYRILSNITWVKKGSFRYSSNGVAQKVFLTRILHAYARWHVAITSYIGIML